VLSEEEEEKGAYRVSVTFSKKDAEWMQKQVDEGEYTSIAEVVRECVRNVRTGGRREGIRIPVGPELGAEPGQEIVIPTEIATQQPDVVKTVIETAFKKLKKEE